MQKSYKLPIPLFFWHICNMYSYSCQALSSVAECIEVYFFLREINLLRLSFYLFWRLRMANWIITCSDCKVVIIKIIEKIPKDKKFSTFCRRWYTRNTIQKSSYIFFGGAAFRERCNPWITKVIAKRSYGDTFAAYGFSCFFLEFWQ